MSHALTERERVVSFPQTANATWPISYHHMLLQFLVDCLQLWSLFYQSCTHRPELASICRRRLSSEEGTNRRCFPGSLWLSKDVHYRRSKEEFRMEKHEAHIPSSTSYLVNSEWREALSVWTCFELISSTTKPHSCKPIMHCSKYSFTYTSSSPCIASRRLHGHGLVLKY